MRKVRLLRPPRPNETAGSPSFLILTILLPESMQGKKTGRRGLKGTQHSLQELWESGS